MKVWGVILTIALFVGAFFTGRWTRGRETVIELRRDTLTLYDTIVKPVPTPEYITVIRTDTCYLRVPADTVKVPVVVPIERKVYQTDDYRAVIEGYRPELVDMQIFRQTRIITQPPSKPKRWGVGVQAGYGLVPATGKFEPYIGIGVQYSIWQW